MTRIRVQGLVSGFGWTAGASFIVNVIAVVSSLNLHQLELKTTSVITKAYIFLGLALMLCTVATVFVFGGGAGSTVGLRVLPFWTYLAGSELELDLRRGAGLLFSPPQLSGPVHLEIGCAVIDRWIDRLD